MIRSIVLIATCLALLGSLTVSTPAYAERLSVAESKRLQVLIKDAKEAKAENDLERVADLLSQAIAIKADPAFRWNLARIYEGLCMFPDAAEQFEALAGDKAVSKDIREQSELRVRGLKRQRTKPSYRVAMKTSGAKLYVDGEDTPTDKDRIRFYNQDASKHSIEAFVPGSWRTRIRVIKATTKRCVTVSDDLEALPPTMARLRIESEAKLSSVEVNGYRLRTQISSLKEIEVQPGDFVIEARTDKGELLSASAAVQAGGVVNISLGTAGKTTMTNGQGEPVFGKRLNRLHAGVSSQSQTQLWGWVTLSAGIAMTGGGFAFLAMAHSEYNDAEKSEDILTKSKANESADSIDKKADGGVAFIGLGAAVAIAGLFFVLSDGEDDNEQAESDLSDQTNLRVLPGLDGSVQMTVSF